LIVLKVKQKITLRSETKMVVESYCGLCGEKKLTRHYDRITKDSQKFCSYECYVRYKKLKETEIWGK
jgi:formate dehydrogenase assembly factor FdhD